jgi:hypothetical protein
VHPAILYIIIATDKGTVSQLSIVMRTTGRKDVSKSQVYLMATGKGRVSPQLL